MTGRVPIHKQLVKFTSSSAGLEKALRLIQSLALVAAQLTTDNVIATRCTMAFSQIALGRRYFRLLDFIGCFEHVQGLMTGDIPSQGTLIKMLEMGESTFLGLYLVLENLTILHDMNVWLVPWYTPLLVEANKFWVYAICLSFARAVCELFFAPSSQSPQDQKSDEKDQEKTNSVPATSPTTPVVKRVIIDGCDLLLPGSFTGWIPASDLAIGITMVVSTVVASVEPWVKAQQ